MDAAGAGDLGEDGDSGGSEQPPPWPGNAADCPTNAPLGALAFATDPGDSVCSVAEGQSCAYWGAGALGTSYKECTCYEQDRSTRRWY